MMKDFKNMQFSLIDIDVNLTPDIIVGKGSITFTKRILEDLKYSANVQYCLNPEEKVFAIRACKGTESRSVPFSKTKSEQKQTLNSSNKNIVEPLKVLLNEYNPEMRYRIQGHFDSTSRTIYFDLDKAVPEAYRAKNTENQ